MSTRSSTRPPVDSGAPPVAPPPAEPPVDEGPMRRELLRQIAQLDEQLGARPAGPVSGRTTPRRGPAVQSNAELEQIRDELLVALRGPVRDA